MTKLLNAQLHKRPTYEVLVKDTVLDPNDKTGFKARELKSVYIDSQCILMKLLFFKHHINKHNVFN